ncbi:MAG: alpha/beta fold hydrolase [Polaromonas sp.]|nr:MAG: alpha/beta fold hydrolase [Polaromonas sp.]
MKRSHFFGIFSALCITMAVLAGCTTLDEKQRAWIFQPSDRTWSGGMAAAEGMQELSIDFQAKADGQLVSLNALWLAADARASRAPEDAPILLYLHGARYNVTGSAPRIRRMQELGFSVLAIDYRGFGKSTPALPSEASSAEDARAAWDWLAAKYPGRARYIFGHSLGGPIAISLAADVPDERGTIVEGTFTSIADVVATSRWGWIPVSLLITQRFEAVRKVGKIGSPLLVVHGEEDRLIRPDLGRKLFDAAAEPKLFVLVPGGSHHNTNQVGQPQYRQALAQLMSLH